MADANAQEGFSIGTYALEKLNEFVILKTAVFTYLHESPLWIFIVGVILIGTPLIWLTYRLIKWIRQDAPQKVRAVKEFVAPTEGQRFRKRDKIEFMGRRVYRNAKAVGSLIRGTTFFE